MRPTGFLIYFDIMTVSADRLKLQMIIITIKIIVIMIITIKIIIITKTMIIRHRQIINCSQLANHDIL